MPEPDRGPSSATRLEGHLVRPEIQALRALAVALVVVFHLWPNRLTGGYVGVDVFFVISGFLITAHLARGMSGPGRFSLAGFYARRIRRLIPASLVVLLIVAVVTILVLPQTLWTDVGVQIIASATYTENWVLAAGAVDYLASSPDASPVQHFWSLSVEEQFYLAWPVLLLLGAALARRSSAPHRGLVVVIAAVTVGSFVFSVIATAAAPWAYFATPARAWEFGIGGLCALLAYRPSASARLRAVLSWAGIAAIIASAFLFTASTPFPGFAALLPVFGTVAVLLAGSPTGVGSPTALYRWRPVQWLGDISYSVYLWHWPLIVLLPIMLGGYGAPLDTPQRLLVIVLTVALAAVSKRFVEDRFRGGPPVAETGRSGSRWKHARVYLAMLVGIMAVVAVAAVPVGIGSARIDAAERSLIHYSDEVAACRAEAGGATSADSCFPPDPAGGIQPDPVIARTEVATQSCQQSAERIAVLTCEFGDEDAEVRVALVGDSHATQWSVMLIDLARERGWSLTTFLKSGCPLTSDPSRTAPCVAWNAAALTQIEAGDFDLAIVSGQGVPPSGGEGDAEYREAREGLASSWADVVGSGASVLAIADTPWPSLAGIHDPPSCVDAGRDCAFRLDVASVADAQAEVARDLEGAGIIDLGDRICAQGVCPSVLDGLLVYRDGSHLTDLFASSLLPYFAARFDALEVFDE